MFANPWIAALIALFAWWLSTGVILWVVKGADGKGRDRQYRSVALASGGLLLGIGAMAASLSMETVGGAYLGFAATLAIWGWIELAFLSGVITGPNRFACPAGTPEWERFLRAWGTIAYHEILLAAALGALVWASWGAENQVGVWSFAVLFFARITAKLNLFFGVPKINTEFLPSTLAHLPSHFRTARISVAFPISVTALSFAVACWLERLYVAETAADVVGFALLAALTGLALLEHWFMVLPLPDEKLWRWMIPARPPETTQTTTQVLRGDTHGV